MPVRAIVQLTGGELVTGAARTAVGHLKGSRDTQGQSGASESRATLEYVVRTTGANPRLVLTIESEKGGTTVRVVDLLAG